MRRRRVAGAIAAAAGLSALAALSAAPAGAAKPDATGYWWRLQTGAGPYLHPPQVPDGGLWVAAEPSGDQAIAAFHVTAPAGMLPERVTLQLGDVTGTPAIVACPTTGKWMPVEAGSWESRPVPDCATARVELTVADDGAALAVPLAALRAGRAANVVLLPAAGSLFSAAMERPGGDAVTLAAAPPAGTPAPTPPTPAVEPAPIAPPLAAPPYAPPTPGFASAPLSGSPAVEPPLATDDDIEDAIGPTRPMKPVSSPVPAGARQPLVVLGVLVVAGAWYQRMRAAVATAAEHPLAPHRVAFARREAQP